MSDFSEKIIAFSLALMVLAFALMLLGLAITTFPWEVFNFGR
jgi:hypothetical protein